MVAAGAIAWPIVSGGFWGLRMHMQERPQFVGPATRSAMTTLVQDSPQAVFRRAGDDVAAVRTLRPALSEVTFDLRGNTIIGASKLWWKWAERWSPATC